MESVLSSFGKGTIKKYVRNGGKIAVVEEFRIRHEVKILSSHTIDAVTCGHLTDD